MKAAFALTLAPLLMGTSAFAQEAPQPTPQPPAAEPTAGTVSDEEVGRFAMAALLVEQISADDMLDNQQKQSAMTTAVQQSGLEPQRFVQIAEASQTDAQLNERIQLAAAQHVQAAQQNQ